MNESVNFYVTELARSFTAATLEPSYAHCD